MKTLLVVGNDKLGRRFINGIENEKYEIVLDYSSSYKRIFKLIKKGTLGLPLVFKMYISDLLRKDFRLNDNYESIKNNEELISILNHKGIEQIVLYRGGLIVNKKVLKLGIRILNIHCAKIPEYGGIGVVDRALNDKAYDQEATLHIITERIDEGEVLSVEPYQLYPDKSYLKNEDTAYETGIKLFNRYFA